MINLQTILPELMTPLSENFDTWADSSDVGMTTVACPTVSNTAVRSVVVAIN